ncbi:MAG: Hsp20/alpha crystallin family protein [Thioalkalispiraceae bacterium]|jgi:HSP20 family protein
MRPCPVIKARTALPSYSIEEKGEYYRCEIRSGTFLRTLTLPAPVDEGNVSAKFKNGMLELELHKLESAKRHSIKIETE